MKAKIDAGEYTEEVQNGKKIKYIKIGLKKIQLKMNQVKQFLILNI